MSEMVSEKSDRLAKFDAADGTFCPNKTVYIFEAHDNIVDVISPWIQRGEIL